MNIKALITALFMGILSAQAAGPCVTNFTIVVTDLSDINYAYLFNQLGCTPTEHTNAWTWSGTCFLDSGTNCTYLANDGSELAVKLNYVAVYDTDIGYCYIRCTNGHIQSHRWHMIIPHGYQICSFRFYALCDAISTCDDAICVSPQ